MPMRIEKRTIDGKERDVIVPTYGWPCYYVETPITMATVNLSRAVGETIASGSGANSTKVSYHLVRRNAYSCTFHVVGKREEIEEEVKNSKKYCRCRLVRWHDWDGIRYDQVAIIPEKEEVTI